MSKHSWPRALATWHLDNGVTTFCQGLAWVPGPDPQRGNYESFAEFADPDGNVWVLQQVNRAEPSA